MNLGYRVVQALTISAVLVGACSASVLTWPHSGVAHADAAPLAPLNQPFVVSNQSTVTVVSGDHSDPLFHKIEQKSYPGPKGGLISQGYTWTGYLKQQNRTITVDLGTMNTLTQISLQCYQDTSRGILFPSAIQFAVSANDSSWGDAGTVHTAYPLYQQGKLIQTYTVSLHNNGARYVRIVFPVDDWVFARNLQVTGSPLLQSSLEQLPPAPNEFAHSGFLSSDNKVTNGVHNMLLVYSGAYGTEGTWSAQDFAPMVTYMSHSGNIEGRMFDSFLFLPYGSELGSQTGWQSYLNDLFTPGQELSALNDAAATAQPELQKLGIQAPTVNVVLTIPYPNSSITDWGQIPGLNQPLSFAPNASSGFTQQQAFADRLLAEQWYVQQLMAKWNQANFTHLRLAGLYWDSESVNYTIPYEAELIHQSVVLSHQYHQPLFWIPSFGASGLVSWNELGFDVVIEQSNFFETTSLPTTRVTEAADQAFQYGLGMEVEMGQSVLTDSTQRARYFNQLVADYKTGVEGNAVHAFYAGSKVLTNVAENSDPAIRQLYVDTYDFLIGQFTNSTYIPVR